MDCIHFTYVKTVSKQLPLGSFTPTLIPTTFTPESFTSQSYATRHLPPQTITSRHLPSKVFPTQDICPQTFATWKVTKAIWPVPSPTQTFSTPYFPQTFTLRGEGGANVWVVSIWE